MAELNPATLEPGLYHEFVSEIEDDPTAAAAGEILPSHNNAKHVSVKLLGYELVEEKELPAGSTTCTFEGLNGDEDEEYLIEGEIDFNYSSSEGYLVIKPNNIPSNQFYSRHFYGHGSGGYNEGSVLPLCNNANGNSEVEFKATLKVKTGFRRKIDFDFYVIHTSDESRYGSKGFGHWNDTTTNITSLVLLASPGTIEGTIRLWKKLPLNNE